MSRPQAQPVMMPGAHTADADDGDTDTLDADDRIAQLEAENRRLRAAADAPKLPQTVYEPTTPHGRAALQASATRDMTVAQVMAAVAAGTLPAPITSYLCQDGYYSRQG